VSVTVSDEKKVLNHRHQTDNLELKKLVYLYLMNYAKSQPDMAIMAVNTFVKDCEDPNPLIRALAVRTMGCIRVDKVIPGY
jgi:AP-1 complex subunit beta-1